ncbi:protealysin inhibitor emfourin [Bordetella genomosp. 13]|uniref:Uncharacterized protein n=1 Tax=Bordetella genomosp. 13 TaxID=463040 RepID=A0A1W6ZA17_9BORD|nr:protealysin inhibitor emfourin [Bordetella genomosp. 13]ARP94223.1 hypothetical protein CAL15_07425 [Bordetella genomosp. 13]
MIALPPLEQATRIRLRREGGIAYLAALARTREIDLQACDPQRRDTLCAALAEAAAQAAPVAGGDQRYYRVEVIFEGAVEMVAFEVAEARLPDALAASWKAGQGRPD